MRKEVVEGMNSILIAMYLKITPQGGRVPGGDERGR